MPRCLSLTHPFLTLSCVLLIPDAAAFGQGRWEVNGGVFHNVIDTQSTSGISVSFARWPGSERVLRRGLRLDFLWGRKDEEKLPAWPEVPLSPYNLIVHSWSSWGLAVGIPFQLGPTSWPIKPFLDADPGLLLYRSLDETRYNRRNGIPYGALYVEDMSGWRLGPTIAVGAGLQIPGRGGSVRFQARGGYRYGYFFGHEGTGLSEEGLQVWTATAGLTVPF